jgi:hypothetical protein
MTEPQRDEKWEKEEKEREKEEKSWEEKWREDPLSAAAWAGILVWAGIALLLGNLGVLDDLAVGSARARGGARLPATDHRQLDPWLCLFVHWIGGRVQLGRDLAAGDHPAGPGAAAAGLWLAPLNGRATRPLRSRS